MAEPSIPLSVPRSALVILYAMHALPKAGSTYRGLAFTLGFTTERGVRKAVEKAKHVGFVTVLHSGNGRGAKAVVRIAMDGARLLRQLGV